MTPSTPERSNRSGRDAYKRGVWLAFAGANALVTGMAVLLSALAYAQAVKGIGDTADAFSQSFANLVDGRFERMRSYQTLLASEMERQLASPGSDGASIDNLIERLDSPDHRAYSARIVDERGFTTHAHDLPRTKGLDYSKRAYFQQLKKDPSIPWILSSPLWGLYTQSPIVVMACPYHSPGGGFAWVVIIRVALKSFQDLLTPNASLGADAVLVRDARDGALLSRSPPRPEDEARIGAKATPDMFKPGVAPYAGQLSPISQAFFKSSLPWIRFDTDDTFDHVRRTLSYHRLQYAPVVVAANIAHSPQHFGAARAQIMASAIFDVGFIGISLIFALSMLRHDLRSRQAEAERDALNADLEGQVAKRTADLEEALALIRQSGAELAQSERLASLGDMAAGVAHELNTPIGNSLLTASALAEEARALKEALSPGAPPATRSKILRHAGLIADLADSQTISAQRSAELVRSFKQVAVDQASSRRRRFDLADCVASVATSLRPSLARAGVAVSIEADIPAGLECDAYPGALIQIANNLIQNAARHAFQGRAAGSIRIQARVVEGPGGAPWIEMDVSDDGAGIAADVLPRIFEPYFTTKANQGGSGIGLSLSRKLADTVLGGFLRAAAPEGGGAIFTLSFPQTSP